MEFRRVRCGRGFSYLCENGERLAANDPIRQRIKQLAIPPAWGDVRIFPRARKILACGRDVKGRKQYIYHPQWQAQQAREKFLRMVRFAKNLPEFRRSTASHLSAWLELQEVSLQSDSPDPSIDRQTVLACMLRLIDSAYFRPGNSHYTAQNNSFGLTTLRSRHLEVEGDSLTFRYRGKSGVLQHKQIDEPMIAQLVRHLDEVPGYRVFKYFEKGEKKHVDAVELNRYLKRIIGEEFSVKDFRTWSATVMMYKYLIAGPVRPDQSKRNKKVVSTLKKVAKKLGNTPAVCRDNYVAPQIIEAYLEASLPGMESIQEDEQNMLSRHESAVLTFLDSVEP